VNASSYYSSGGYFYANFTRPEYSQDGNITLDAWQRIARNGTLAQTELNETFEGNLTLKARTQIDNIWGGTVIEFIGEYNGSGADRKISNDATINIVNIGWDYALLQDSGVYNVTVNPLVTTLFQLFLAEPIMQSKLPSSSYTRLRG